MQKMRKNEKNYLLRRRAKIEKAAKEAKAAVKKKKIDDGGNVTSINLESIRTAE